MSLAHKLDYGRWRSLQGYGAFAAPEREQPLYVQFSGGRTSGFLAAMAPDEAVITYQNTGREDEKTLEFIRNVGDALDREIIWLEFRPPVRIGDAPKHFLYERVDFKRAARKGEPFAEMMRAINAYRAACGNGPVAPWAKGRICTVHLKHRVLDHYVCDLGVYGHDRFIGLRADEPDRVRGLHKQQTLDKGLFAPLATAGVAKGDVLEFWARQPFDLDLPEHDGNCDGCFLKDQADISRSLGRRPTAVAWWQNMMDTYPRFGGVGRARYDALADELPARLAMEKAFSEGRRPENDHGMDPKRFRLVVIQERKRYENGPNRFSCACEGSMSEDPEDETDEAGQLGFRFAASTA